MNQIYYKDLSKFKLLNDEEITEIYKRYNRGDNEALNEMVVANLKFVVSIAKQYHKTIKDDNIISLDDLISEGNIGLIKACQKFNIELGIKFSSYAIYWIRNTIQSSINKNQSNIRSPDKLLESDRRIHKTVCELFQKNESEVTINEVSLLNIFTKNEINHYFNNQRVFNVDNIPPIEDEVQEMNEDESIELKRKIAIALKELTPQERNFIQMNFGLNGRPKESIDVWLEMGVSRQRAHQLKHSAYNKLRTILKDINK